MHCSGECAVDSSGECVGERSVVENALENGVGNAVQNAVQWRMYLRMQGGSTGECRGVGQVQLDLSQVQEQLGQVQ